MSSLILQDTYKPCITSKNQSGECKPTALCIGLTDKEEMENQCQMGDKETFGICCSSVTKPQSQGRRVRFVKVNQEVKVESNVTLQEVEQILEKE